MPSAHVSGSQPPVTSASGDSMRSFFLFRCILLFNVYECLPVHMYMPGIYRDQKMALGLLGLELTGICEQPMWVLGIKP